jgi:hypothetical protein
MKKDKAAKARQELVRLSETSRGRLGDWKWNREDIYDRPVLSRRESLGARGSGEAER